MVRLCVLGSTNVDLTFRVPRLPRPGETLSGTALTTGFGGKGANQAVFAARLGAEVAMISAVGADAFGTQALANYRQNGVEIAHVRVVADCPTGTAAILVDDAAANCIVVVAGANGMISLDDVRAARPAIISAAVLVAQLETPIEPTVEAFRVARSVGVRTILNPAPARPLPDELLALCDLCVPNETELETLTGLPAGEEAAQALRRRGPEVVIVTLGEKGALVVKEQGSETIAAPVVRAVDPTGAGDAFIGALAVLLAERLPLRDAVGHANRLAALTVTRAGAQESFPSREQLHKEKPPRNDLTG